MKTKRIFSLTLICMLLLSVAFGSVSVSAKGKLQPMKVAFKGKTVTLFKDTLPTAKNQCATMKKVQKAWGKGKKKPYGSSYSYTWKKGKTEIMVTDNWYKGRVGGMTISIKDKNASMMGVKVGMTKAQALKKLKKTFGSRVKNIKFSDGTPAIQIENTMCSFSLKSGKVIRMSYFSS